MGAFELVTRSKDIFTWGGGSLSKSVEGNGCVDVGLKKGGMGRDGWC